MKKSISIVLLVGLLVFSAVGVSTANFRLDRDINVISREAGSGTRGAFIELMGIEERTPDGSKVDRTTIEAIIANKTDVVLASVANNPYSIGYISLGSLNDRVKALKIDGVEPSQEAIASGEYKVARPFNIAFKNSLDELGEDFVNFIMSTEGQNLVSDNYIPVVQGETFSTTQPSGKIVVAGSSSVSPLIEKLAEAYLKFNNNADIEIQTSDSTAGMIGAIEGTCDIGMASREMKAEELEQLESKVIAQDGIAVIVHNDNPLENLTADQVKDIYVGETTTWEL